MRAGGRGGGFGGIGLESGVGMSTLMQVRGRRRRIERRPGPQIGACRCPRPRVQRTTQMQELGARAHPRRPTTPSTLKMHPSPSRSPSWVGWAVKRGGTEAKSRPFSPARSRRAASGRHEEGRKTLAGLGPQPPLTPPERLPNPAKRGQGRPGHTPARGGPGRRRKGRTQGDPIEGASPPLARSLLAAARRTQNGRACRPLAAAPPRLRHPRPPRTPTNTRPIISSPQCA